MPANFLFGVAPCEGKPFHFVSGHVGNQNADKCKLRVRNKEKRKMHEVNGFSVGGGCKSGKAQLAVSYV